MSPSRQPPIDAATRLLGVIGHPVGHSLSPAMHNLALERLGLNLRYLAFDIPPEQLAHAVTGMATLGMPGFNATIPHKEALLPLMTTLSPEAERIGAVNTVLLRPDGTRMGHNTDGDGFMTALRESWPGDLSTRRVVILGAGGATRAILDALLHAGVAAITVANRTTARAGELQRRFGAFHPNVPLSAVPLDPLALPLEQCDLLVNTTSQGLHGEALDAVDLARLPKTAAVCDIVYGRETPLLRTARAHGLTAIDGLGMLIHQGARAFQLWTGETMPVEPIRLHLQRILENRP